MTAGRSGVDERGAGTTVLVVDDHAVFRAVVRAVLEADGYTVVGEAADGESAVEAARQLRPAIILLDVALPDIDGFAVCARVCDEARDDGSGVPVVVLTSSRDASAFRRRLAVSSAHGFVAKKDLSGAALAALVGAPPDRGLLA
jgi:CheY-like chemotaxis protein